MEKHKQKRGKTKQKQQQQKTLPSEKWKPRHSEGPARLEAAAETTAPAVLEAVAGSPAERREVDWGTVKQERKTTANREKTKGG